jgi:hypothetical protein
MSCTFSRSLMVFEKITRKGYCMFISKPVYSAINSGVLNISIQLRSDLFHFFNVMTVMI